MSASSIAAAAVGASSFSLSSPYSIDQFPVRSLIPSPVSFRATSKIRSCVKYAPFYALSRCAVKCASTVFDGVELNKEEDEIDHEEANEEEGEEEEVAVSEIEEEDNEVAKPVDGGRLYVGNLPFSMTSTQLSEIFAEAGHVASVEVVYDRVTDRSRGFAFVTMATIDEAKEAIRLFDGAQLGGRTAKVNFPEVPRGGEREVMLPKIRSSYQGFVDSPHKIYAGNLSWGLTSQALRDAFSQQPGFLSAKVIYDRDSGRSRGFGFVTFSSAQDVESAINAMNGVEVEGRPLRLNLAEQKSNNPSSTQAENSEQLSSVA